MLSRRWLFALFLAAPAHATAQEQALSDLKALAASCERAFAAEVADVEPAARPGMWFRRVTSPGAVAFDARKTDSIVSPFVGEVRVTTVVSLAPMVASEAEAQALPASAAGKPARTVVSVRLAYTDGRWRVTGSTESVAPVARPGEREFDPVVLVRTAEQTLQPFRLSARCVGELSR